MNTGYVVAGSLRKARSGVNIQFAPDRPASTSSPRESGDGPSRPARPNVSEPVGGDPGVGSGGADGRGSSDTVTSGPSLAVGRISGWVSVCSSVSMDSSVGLAPSLGSSEVEVLGSGLSAAVGCAVAPTSPSVTAGAPLLSHINGVGETAISRS
ncbi:hypothetical protein SALBM217S_05577 [Streptomyces griseoloalbus]